MPVSRPSIPAVSAAGDAVTLEAGDGSARDGSRGRLLAQLEHNAMRALGLVRAGMLALQAVNRQLERATHLLSRHHGVLEAHVADELRRVFSELVQYVQTASHDGHPLLDGTTVPFSLDDAWQEASEPLQVELPDLSRSVVGDGGLHGLELSPRMVVLPVLQRLNHVRSAQQQGQVSLQRAAQQLNVVLSRLHESRAKHATRKEAPDNFKQLAERLRDHVLRAGGSALRVQGSPSTRAAGLVEGLEESV